jgi:polyisoprenoid-binding protein YceI
VQSGTVDFDPSAQKISGSIVIAAGSGDSGEPGRDTKMNGDVLDVAHYAQVTFEPKTYQGALATTGDSTIQMWGVLTLHGTPHDISVPMQLHFEGSALNAKTHFVIPYVKWGLKDPSIFILKVAKEVDIDVTLVGTVSAGN